MKKVLSFVLVLSMILGSFGMAFAAPATDVVGTDYEDAVNVLTELGVVAGYKDGTYRPANVVTRAEMATFIIKAMGLNDYVSGASSFSDMAGHWADPYVAYATSLGFIKGNTDGTFAPDAAVTYDQAITMVVQALGYKAEYLVGTYPGAFVNQAKALGILEGIKAGAAGANRGDIAKLLFNTLDIRFVRYNNEGTVENAGGTMRSRLIDAQAYLEKAIVIDADEDATIKLKEYQGAYADVYLNKYDEIVAVKEVKSVFLTGKFDVDALTTVQDLDNTGLVTFTTEDDVEYTIKQQAVNATTGGIKTFTDGEEAGTYADVQVTDAATYTLGVKISGKKIVNLYSVAKWDAEAPIQWTEELAEELAEDDELDNKKFVMTDNDEIDLDEFALFGVDSLEDIKEDDVVTYYLDAASKIAKVEVSSEVVEGKITKVNADNEVYINGKYYALNTAGDLDITGTTADLGVEGKFFLDYAGDIAFDDTTSATADDYAIVLATDNGEDGLRAADALIQLLLADGSVATYSIDKDALEEGNIQKVSPAALSGAQSATVGAIDAVEDGFATGVAIKYNLNKDGKIDMITGVALSAATDDVTAKGTFDGHKIAENAVILGTEVMVSSASGVVCDDDEKFEVVKRDALLEQKEVTALYEVNAKGEIVFMVVKQDGVSGTHFWGVVTGVEALEDDMFEVTILSGSESKVYTTDDNTLVKAVTLYAIDFDANGYANNVTAGLEAEEQLVRVTSANIGLSATGAAVSRVSGNKVYSGSEYTYEMTLDNDVVVYEVNEAGTAYEEAATSDIRGHLNGIEFYDFDEDKVIDIVLLK